MGHAGEQSQTPRRPASSPSLGPLLAVFLQVGHFQVRRSHYRVDLALGVELKKPGFGNGGDLRCIRKVDDQNAAAMTFNRREIDGLRLGFIENSLDFLSNGAVLYGSVERFDRKLDFQKHSHGYHLVVVELERY